MKIVTTFASLLLTMSIIILLIGSTQVYSVITNNVTYSSNTSNIKSTKSINYSLTLGILVLRISSQRAIIAHIHMEKVP